MAEHDKLDMEKWKIQRDRNIKEMRRLNDEEALTLGKISKLEKQLVDIRRMRDGIEFAIASGDDVADIAQEEFHLKQHENEEKESDNKEE